MYCKIKNELIKEFSKIIKTGEFILSSGLKSNFYINAKEILIQSKTINLIVDYIDDLNLEFTNVAGITSGSDSIVCGVVMRLNKNGLFIRKNQKKYGTKNIIEGMINIDKKNVLIVDDVLTTGKSIKYLYQVLKEFNFNPVGVVIVIDREEYNAKYILEKELNIPIYSILIERELIKYKFNSDGEIDGRNMETN